MKNIKLILTLILTSILMFVALPSLSAFAANYDPSLPYRVNAATDETSAFVSGEVLAPADSWDHAHEIADFYGLELKSYAYGIAVLAAANPEQAVAASASPTPSSSVLQTKIPPLSLNLIYETCEVAYSYDTQLNTTALPRFENMPSTSLQWHHAVMNNGLAWGLSTGEGVIVAVIDSGIDIDHPAFTGRISEKSYNSYTNQIGISYVRDDSGHGTHVSGIIAASPANGQRVLGVAPDTGIMTIKANIPSIPSYFDESSLLRAINYAVRNNANIINMSLGRNYAYGENELEHSTIANAVASGVTVVCSAGNNRNNHAGYPAAYSETIAVTALKQSGLFDSNYSNYGPEIDVAAPGTDILSTARGGGYVYMTGTSMASPNVAGAAALIKSLYPEYTPDQVRNTLRATAQYVGAPVRDDRYGYGVVNTYAALLGVDALCDITYDFNDGEHEPVTMKAAPGGKLIEPETPWRKSYLFTGWYSSETNDLFNFATYVVNGNLYLYAGWLETESGTFAHEFPDMNFRSEVLKLLNNLDGGNRVDLSVLSSNDLTILASVYSLNFTYVYGFGDVGMNIRDLTGLQYFTGLVSLSCSNNLLTELDVSRNTELGIISCANNKLSALDVSNNTYLGDLNCSGNQLTALDLSNNPWLYSLYCNDNQLTTLNVSHITGLGSLFCGNNQLSALDISNNINLWRFYCSNNKINSLDFSNNTSLVHLNCSGNQLTTMDLSKNTNIINLYCNNGVFQKEADFVDILKKQQLRAQ